MELRKLGLTDIHVSPLGLGTVKFGRNQGVKYPDSFDIPDEPFLANLLAQAKDIGINMLDTAPAYGESEERLGRLLKGQRDEWVIIGKAGEEFRNGKSTHNFTPEHFEQSLTGSLKQLQTDYLDIFLIHSNGSDMDIIGNEALIAKMQSFKDRGLVRAIGASTKTPEGGIKTLELMDVVMATYTPDYLDEKPVLDYAAKTGKAVILKKMLNSGNISTESGDRSVDKSVERAFHHAFSHKGTTAAIVGTINPDHLCDNVKIMQRILPKAV